MLLNLDEFRAQGIQPSETLLSTAASATGPEFNQTVVEQLMMMGFSDIRAKKACLATGGLNSNADSAMTWLFEHMEDLGIDDPIPSATSAGNDMDIVYDEAQLGNLMDMGFSVGQAKKAIKETGGNMERAVDWLFSHSGEPVDDEPANTTTTDTDAQPVIDTAPANYKLISFISHKGTSTACGHYVSHIYNEDKKCWVLFNDNKVAKVPEDSVNESVEAAYMYCYKKA
jgi:ubiquitin carboxyl-terminal hydrolase 5/13